MAVPVVAGIVVGVILVVGLVVLTVASHKAQRNSYGPARAEPYNQWERYNRSRPSSSNRQRRSFQDEDSCKLCLKSLDISPVRTSCGHEFHPDCIKNWMQESRTCPVCRKSL